MPKFVIERQYLVPMYQHIIVEADNLEEACEKADSDDIDWDTQEMDCDSARATTITEAKVIPEGYEADVVHSLIIASRDPRGLPLDMLSLATFLYEDEAKTGPPPPNPREIHRRQINRHASSAAVEGAHGAGAVRLSRSCRKPQQEQTCGPRRGLRRSSVTREGLATQASLIPAPAPTSTASHPCTQKRVGAEASGEGTPAPPDLKGVENS